MRRWLRGCLARRAAGEQGSSARCGNGDPHACCSRLVKLAQRRRGIRPVQVDQPGVWVSRLVSPTSIGWLSMSPFGGKSLLPPEVARSSAWSDSFAPLLVTPDSSCGRLLDRRDFVRGGARHQVVVERLECGRYGRIAVADARRDFHHGITHSRARTANKAIPTKITMAQRGKSERTGAGRGTGGCLGGGV